MSKRSLMDQDEPYYRKFGKPAWYRKQPQFPEGRDPYADLFKDETVAEIIRKISPKLKPDPKTLQADLRDLAHDYMVAAFTAPFGINCGPTGMTRNERKRWLRPNVLTPATKLLEALSDKNAHQLFEWPEDKIGADPDKKGLTLELTRLLERVGAVYDGVEERETDGSDVLTEFKKDFANALTLVFMKHYPTLPAHVSEYDTAKRPSSEYFKFLRLCANEIFKGDLVLAVDLADGLTEPKRKR